MPTLRIAPKGTLAPILLFLLNRNTETLRTEGGAMAGNWRYMLGAILFLSSGCLFLFTAPRWGLFQAYLVSLPIFAVGLILVVWAIWKR